MQNDSTSAAQALAIIIEALSGLDDEARGRVLKSVATFFHTSIATDLPGRHHSSETESQSVPAQQSRPNFSEDLSPSPKQFVFEKQPQTDVERIACLAYYLTNYRDMPHFKTLDLAKLNTEAAQPKFSNTAWAATNATSSGYLVAAPKGDRQLTAAGEQFVLALPDRIAAKAAMTAARKKSASRKKRSE